MAWLEYPGDPPNKPFHQAKLYNGIVAHAHVQVNRADGHCGTYYLKLRYEGKDHKTAYKEMLKAANDNKYDSGRHKKKPVPQADKGKNKK